MKCIWEILNYSVFCFLFSLLMLVKNNPANCRTLACGQSKEKF